MTSEPRRRVNSQYKEPAESKEEMRWVWLAQRKEAELSRTWWPWSRICLLLQGDGKLLGDYEQNDRI